MQHKSFDDMACPIARSLDKVGEWWSILILREIHKGRQRFDELQSGLGIGSATLCRRLNRLVEVGLLERRVYSHRPLRHEYVLTDAGRDFRPVLQAFLAWGHKHALPHDDAAEAAPSA